MPRERPRHSCCLLRHICFSLLQAHTWADLSHEQRKKFMAAANLTLPGVPVHFLEARKEQYNFCLNPTVGLGWTLRSHYRRTRVFDAYFDVYEESLVSLGLAGEALAAM